MKKTRLISLLLTAALALSSMPIMVSAAQPATERIDVLANAVAAEADVTDVTDLTIGSGNKYLHVFRGADTTGFIYTPASMEAGKTYYIEFDARNAVENIYSDGIVNHFRMRAGGQRWATKAAVNSDPVNQPDLVIDGAIVGDTSSFGGAGDWVHKAIVKDGWIHYTLALTAGASDSSLQFYGGSMPGGSCDIQIDNFRFYEEGTSGVTINFENGEAPGFSGRSTSIAVVESADYTKAASGVATFAVNQDIAGGACPFIGDVRYGTYHADNTTYANNYANVAVIAVVDGVDYEIASVDGVKVANATEGTGWFALNNVADLPAGNLSEIKLVSEDAQALNSAIHFKNFSFKVPVESSPATEYLASAAIAEADVTDVTDLTIGSGNKYLHVFRGADTTGFIYTPASMEAGKTYYIEFDARNAVENIYSDGIVNHFRMRAGSQRWATKAAVNSDPVNQPDLVVDGAIVGDTSSFGSTGDWVHKAIVKDGWIHYTLALTAKAGDSSLQFYGGSMPGGSCDIQIDNFRFYEEGTSGVTINFENGEAPGFSGRSTSIAVVESADYTKAGSGNVTYVINRNIGAGVCLFTGDVRYGAYHADNTTYANNYADVTVIAVVDGVDYEIASVDGVKVANATEGTGWFNLDTVLEGIPAGLLSEVKVVSTDAAGLNTPIHLKNFSFTVVIPQVNDEEDKGQMPNLGIVMVLLAKKRAATEGGAAGDSAFTVNGAALATKTVKAVEGNKYLEVSNRLINTTGVKLVTALPAGDYTLDFDLRSSVELEVVADAGIDFNTNEGGDIFRIRTSSATTVFTDFAKDGWKTFSYAFTSDGENQVGIEIYGGYSQMQCMPFDIDNVVIKDADGKAIYTENFDALEAQDFGTTIALTGAATDGSAVNFAPRGEASFAIIAEDAYVSAKVEDKAVVSYTGEALAAGNYVAKGYIRNSYFNAIGSQKETSDAAVNSADYLSWFAADTTFTYNGEEITAAAGFVALNKNKFALKVSVGAETASYTVTSRWTAFEVPFTVAEGDAAPVVTFEIDHDMPYTINKKAVVPFDLKLEIVAAQ